MWGDRQTPHSVTREITREMASAGSFVRSGLAFCLEVAHPELTRQESLFSRGGSGGKAVVSPGANTLRVCPVSREEGDPPVCRRRPRVLFSSWERLEPLRLKTELFFCI